MSSLLASLVVASLVANDAPLSGNGSVAPCGEDGMTRAGNPMCLSRWAKPSRTCYYQGYYVGGGAKSAKKAEPRFGNEGTWGWDDTGKTLKAPNVALGWWHGRKAQGGTGAYSTHAPHILDVPNAIRPIKKPDGSQEH